MDQERTKTEKITLGIVGITTMVFGSIVTLFMLIGIVLSLTGVSDTDLTSIGGSNSEPMSAIGGLLMITIFGVFITYGGYRIFKSRNVKKYLRFKKSK